MAKGTTATLKFFNHKKGYGFFERENGSDIFVHATVVEASGFDTKSMMDGVEAVFEYEVRGDKLQTVSIQLLGGLKGSTRRAASKKTPRQGGATNQKTAKVDEFHVGQVKFFNEEKGYGFLVILDEENYKDLFLHVSNVPGDLQPPQKDDIFDIVVNEKDGKVFALVLQEHEGDYADVAQKAA